MKTTRIPARQLKRGMTFVMGQTKCFVVNAELNKLGQTEVCFVKNPSNNSKISNLVVTQDFLFKTN